MCLSFKDLRFAIGLSWKAASIWVGLVSLLLSLSWALASLSCSVAKERLPGPFDLDRQQGPAAIAVVTLS